MTETQIQKIRNAALRKFTLRDHSVAELRTYLDLKFKLALKSDSARIDAAETGFNPSTLIDQWINDWLELGLLNESRFTENVLRSEIAKGKSFRRISDKLKMKGQRVSAEELERLALDKGFIQAPADSAYEEAQIMRFLERKFPKAKLEKFRSDREGLYKEQSRAFGGLARRGFPLDEVGQLLKKWFKI